MLRFKPQQRLPELRFGYPPLSKLESVNSGMFQVPDSHPTPSASLSGFGVFLSWYFLVGLVLRLRGGGLASLCRFLLLQAHVMLA